MKMLVVGPGDAAAFPTACSREFRKLGHEVLQWDNKPRRWWLGGRRWWDLTPPERAVSDMATALDLYRTAKRWRPDVIFMAKGENVRAEVFTQLKKELNCRLAIWYVDNPFHANVSSFQALRHIQKSDIYFIWSKALVDALKSAGARRAEYLPFAFDPETFPDMPESAIAEDWRSDVCFVGTWDPEREDALLPLAGREFNLAIYGQGWESSVCSKSPLRAHIRRDAIWRGNVVKAFKGAQLVLNLLRIFNYPSHNFRTMEATGIGGGALATPWTPDQANVLFEENQEVLCYQGMVPDPHWITEKLTDGDDLQKVSAAAQKRVFNDHLLSMRITEILNHLESS